MNSPSQPKKGRMGFRSFNSNSLSSHSHSTNASLPSQPNKKIEDEFVCGECEHLSQEQIKNTVPISAQFLKYP